MKQLVRLNKRPSNNGKSFTYVLRYVDLDGSRKMESLGSSKKYLGNLNEFFRICDLVKFAKYKPNEKDFMKAFEIGIGFLE